MKIRLGFIAGAPLALAVCVALGIAAAQTPRELAEKELARQVPAGSIKACSLITRQDVTKATGRDPLVDAEPAGQGGWVCNVGEAELKVYSGPKSSQAWDSLLKSFKMDKLPKIAASGFGERAYFLYQTPDNPRISNVAFLVVTSGNHALALSPDAPDGKPAESMRPALESLMKTILARLR